MRGRVNGVGGNVWKTWKMRNWMSLARPMMIAMRMVKCVMEFKMLVVFVRWDFAKFHVSKTKLSIFNKNIISWMWGNGGVFQDRVWHLRCGRLRRCRSVQVDGWEM
jgi:hypothetical protein